MDLRPGTTGLTELRRRRPSMAGKPRNLRAQKKMVTYLDSPHVAHVSIRGPEARASRVVVKIRNMEEFAAASGISRPTVSKYFNDPGSVRQSTRDKIEEALQRYEYRPNIYAVNQNRKLTKNVGVIVPFMADPFFAEIARQIEQRCIEAAIRAGNRGRHSGRPARDQARRCSPCASGARVRQECHREILRRCSHRSV